MEAHAVDHRPEFFELQSDDVPLSRYMDLAGLLDLLTSSDLHFARADQMDDPWEGHVLVLPEDLPEEWPSEVRLGVAASSSLSSRLTYLSCWHIGADESFAMWKIYDASQKGVAIRTTSGRLWQSIQAVGRRYVTGGAVQYVDYETFRVPQGNSFSPLLYKRTGYSFESEYRLMAMWEGPGFTVVAPGDVPMAPAPHDHPAVLKQPVDLQTLVSEISVSPAAPGWVQAVIQRIVDLVGLDVEVSQSRLASSPTNPAADQIAQHVRAEIVLRAPETIEVVWDEVLQEVDHVPDARARGLVTTLRKNVNPLGDVEYRHESGPEGRA